MKTGKGSRIVVLASAYICANLLGGCSSGNSSAEDSPETKMAGYQVLSKQNLESILKDPDSANYQNVHGYRIDLGEGDQYVFCGQVNAKNSFGGYTGYEDFVATPVISVLASQASDFDQVQEQFCNPANDMGEVWF